VAPPKLMAKLPRLGYLLGCRDLQLAVWLPDYFYTGHATTLAGIPFDAGWQQGLGFVVVEAEWKRRAE
jgi:hypothetical protein